MKNSRKPASGLDAGHEGHQEFVGKKEESKF